MGTTANQSYPYPAGSDAVDVPGDIQALADAVDSDVAAIEANDWVTTARIDDGAVTAAKLATDAVETAKIDDGAVTNAKLAVPKVDQAVVGNLLTDNQATGTDTLGTTAGFSSTDTIARSTAQALSGTGSLLMTHTATGASRVFGTPRGASGFAVTPGVTYTGSVSILNSSGSRTWRGQLLFWTAAGAFISGVDAGGTSAPSWTTQTFTGVAPATAAFANVEIVSTNAGSIGDAAYADNWGFWKGAGGLWAPPGTPIANLGTRTDPTNSAQVQVWNPGNNTWITV